MVVVVVVVVVVIGCGSDGNPKRFDCARWREECASGPVDWARAWLTRQR